MSRGDSGVSLDSTTATAPSTARHQGAGPVRVPARSPVAAARPNASTATRAIPSTICSSAAARRRRWPISWGRSPGLRTPGRWRYGYRSTASPRPPEHGGATVMHATGSTPAPTAPAPAASRPASKPGPSPAVLAVWEAEDGRCEACGRPMDKTCARTGRDKRAVRAGPGAPRRARPPRPRSQQHRGW